MRIHFSNVDFRSQSGPNTFASRLALELNRRGHEIVDHYDQYDIFLCFIEPTSNPRPDAKIIQRLDGIWFKPDEFLVKNKNIKWAYDNADCVVWQSNFDKTMTEKHWGPKKGSVVHNGIQLNSKVILDPQLQNLRNKSRKIFVASANWHRQKRLKENIEFYLANREDEDTMIVLGANPDYIVHRKDIIYAGHCSHSICQQVYSISDWMIHLAWLDHCPNVVVEALSQNCPVICNNSGGTREIVRENGLVLAEDHEYDFSLLDYDKPYELNSHKIKQDLPKIKVDNSYLNIELVANQYEEIFKWV